MSVDGIQMCVDGVANAVPASAMTASAATDMNLNVFISFLLCMAC
jgi:hypothetical protein